MRGCIDSFVDNLRYNPSHATKFPFDYSCCSSRRYTALRLNLPRLETELYRHSPEPTGSGFLFHWLGIIRQSHLRILEIA